jgi:hypothetical protein
LFGQKCGCCDEFIEDDVLYALDQAWHKDHFCCTVCQEPFESLQYYAGDDKKPYWYRDKSIVLVFSYVLFCRCHLYLPRLP